MSWFFKTDAERASAQVGKARGDAAEAGSNAASGARHLGAAVLATLAEATAPADDTGSRKHARKTRAKALKAASHDRAAAAKAAAKASEHGRAAAQHGRKALDTRSAEAGGTVAALAGTAGAAASVGAHRAAEVAREQGAHAAEVLRERSAHAASAVKERSGPLGESAAEKAGIGAAVLTALAAAAREKAAETRNRAVSGVDHGIDAAVPRAQEGVAAVAPKVDHLRDLINDELLPKLQTMIGDVQTGKDRVLAREEGAIAALTGAPKARRRKGGGLIAIGVLAAAGAAVAWYLAQQQRQQAADPWTSTTDPDPWASRSPVGTDDVTVAAVPPVTESAVAEPVLDTATDELVTDELVADAPVTDAPVTDTEASGTVRMLEPEEIDELGSETPLAAEEQAPADVAEADLTAADRTDDRADDRG